MSEHEVRRVYANHTTGTGSPFDLTLDFGYRNADEEVEHQVRVVLAWEHALAVVRLMEAQLEAYQAELGPLPDIEKARLDVEVERHS